MTASKITLSQLESRLWEAANILHWPVNRGLIDTPNRRITYHRRLAMQAQLSGRK